MRMSGLSFDKCGTVGMPELCRFPLLLTFEGHHPDQRSKIFFITAVGVGVQMGSSFDFHVLTNIQNME